MSESASINYAGNSSPPPVTSSPRLWVGVLLVILQWLLIKVPAWLAPGTMYQFMAMMWAPIIGAASVIVWWLFFSRLPWSTRWIGLLAFLGGFGIALGLGDRVTMMMGFIVFAMPLIITIWVLWTLVGVRIGQTPLRAGLIVLLMGIWSVFAMLRMNGLDGSINASLSWRWTPTAEQRFLANRPAHFAIVSPTAGPTTTPAHLTLSPGDWPEFRGPNRDGRLVGVTIKSDWNEHPPRKLWGHLIGPGWSSLCVVGDYVFTQEQRGPVEVVSCYSAETGNEIWVHEDQERFEESIGGPGPRATPTFHEGRLYTYGAKGRLNCLDPITGQRIWSRDAAGESGAMTPMWGFASSPLVSNGLVTVMTGAKDKSIMAYKADTGERAWSIGSGYSYSSPQISRVAGAEQLLYVTEEGVTGLDPLAGTVVWQHHFQMPPQANRVTQPLLIDENDLLLGAYFGVGTRRVHITHDHGDWKTEALWTSPSIKPYYNDGVIHQGKLYGFDGSKFCCINLDTGKPYWRSPISYGNGQVLLIADQNLLLILSEQGDAVLVEAKPDASHEVGRFHALDGKTWNHPVIAHQKLFVRNGEEIACYAVP